MAVERDKLRSLERVLIELKLDYMITEYSVDCVMVGVEPGVYEFVSRWFDDVRPAYSSSTLYSALYVNYN